MYAPCMPAPYWDRTSLQYEMNQLMDRFVNLPLRVGSRVVVCFDKNAPKYTRFAMKSTKQAEMHIYLTSRRMCHCSMLKHGALPRVLRLKDGLWWRRRGR